MDAICAVLAGGLGSRLGRPKAGVPLAGRPLISYPVAAAAEAGIESVVVAKRDSELPELDVELVVEPDERRHPLSGILAALDAGEGRPVIALGCDMPFVPAALLAHLASLGDQIAICQIGGRLQPLLGRYDPSLAVHLSNALEEEMALTEAVVGLEPRIVREAEVAAFGDPARIAFNVNDEADLARAAELLRN
jgi:molybdenum cofactor guanylyltransferase